MINVHTLAESGLWLGSEASFHSLVRTVEEMTNASKEAFGYSDRDDDEEESGEHFLLDIVGNVGVIAIKGKMVPGVEGSWGQYWGLVGYGDINNAIITAINAGVTDLIFDYDTGGGAVNGIAELADFKKKLPSLGISTTSYSGGSVMSGGLWLATAAETFQTTRMAEIGSLGVIAVTAEMTELYKKEGISVEVHKSTPLKAAGNPYEKLTEPQRAEIQKNIMEVHEFFISEISVNRNLSHAFVSDEIANGKTWFGDEAKRLGLVDSIDSFDSILLALRKESADNHSFQHVEASNMARRKQILDDKAAAAIASGIPPETVIENLDAEQESPDDGQAPAPKEEAAAAAAAAPKEEAEAQETATEVSTVTALTKQIDDLQDKVVDLKVSLKTAENSVSALETSQKGLREATVAAIQRGFVALGSNAPAQETLMAMDSSALLAQHAQIMGQVNQRYGAGGQVTTTVDDSAADTELDLAAKQANEALLRQATI